MSNSNNNDNVEMKDAPPLDEENKENEDKKDEKEEKKEETIEDIFLKQIVLIRRATETEEVRYVARALRKLSLIRYVINAFVFISFFVVTRPNVVPKLCLGKKCDE